MGDEHGEVEGRRLLEDARQRASNLDPQLRPRPPEQHGRQLFVTHCGSCHTLDAAGTTGQIGPDLGDIPRSDTEVLAAIRRGGGQASKGAGGQTGSLPPNLVTGKDAQDVAKFVGNSGPGTGD